MKAKINLILAAATTLCLASCQKELASGETQSAAGDGEYFIEIAGLGQTKNLPASQALDLADWGYVKNTSLTAQLKKVHGADKENVANGVTYKWRISGQNIFSLENNKTQQCNLTALSTGSSCITVSAELNGTLVASKTIPVTIADNRGLSWESSSATIRAGKVDSTVVTSTYKCSATVSPNNSLLEIGTAPGSLGTSPLNIDFNSTNTAKIYYRYTNPNASVVNLTAQASGAPASSQVVNVNAAQYEVTQLLYTPASSVTGMAHSSGYTLTISGVRAVFSNGFDNYESSYTNYSISLRNVSATSTVSGNTITFTTNRTSGGRTAVSLISNDNDRVNSTPFTVNINYSAI